MSTKAPSTKLGSSRTILGSLATFYHRRWLIRYLVRRDVISNYRSSRLGVVWAFLSPLLMVALLTIVFSEALGIKFREVTGDSSLNFGLYMYCGLLPFLAYSEALTRGVSTIRRNSDLVQKVVFPLEILPLIGTITSFIMRNVFGVGALLAVLLVLNHRLNWTVVLLPLVVVPQLLFTLGLNYLVSVTGTYVPDIREALKAVVRATFFISPILWPSGRVPPDYRFLVDYNPLAFLIDTYRDLILEGTLPSGTAAIYFSLFAAAVFVVGFAVFQRLKHNFGDLL